MSLRRQESNLDQSMKCQNEGILKWDGCYTSESPLDRVPGTRVSSKKKRKNEIQYGLKTFIRLQWLESTVDVETVTNKSERFRT